MLSLTVHLSELAADALAHQAAQRGAPPAQVASQVLERAVVSSFLRPAPPPAPVAGALPPPATGAVTRAPVRCAATRHDGEPCRALAGAGGGLCARHDPLRAEARRQRTRQRPSQLRDSRHLG